MRAKELQVGDWCLYGQRYSIIKTVSYERVSILVNTGYQDEIIVETLDNIEPIPLTTEILEKNGFKFLIEDKKYKTLCLNEPYINCTFVKEFKDWMITVGAAGSLKKRFVEVSKVQFVHEMQHLLRLCKYEIHLKI